jgi:hypothetical protein
MTASEQPQIMNFIGPGYLPVCMMCEVWKSHASSLVNTQGGLCYWWLVMDNRYIHVAVSCEGPPSPCDSTYRPTLKTGVQVSGEL